MNRYINYIKNGFSTVYFNEEKNRTTFSKLKMISFSLLLSFLLASIMIIVKGENPFVVFQLIFEGAVGSEIALNDMLLNVGMYIAVGIGIIISFKAGLFNVGITGQLYLGGSIALLVGITTHIHWIWLVIIAIIVAATLGALGGILKAFFNIHEVVGTILLNWIAYYLVRYIFSPGQSFMETTSSKPLIGNSIMGIAGSAWIPALILSLFLLLLYWIIMKKTTLGFSFKLLGSNKNASKYSGINIKAKTVIAMTLSAIGAGLLGAIMFLGRDKIYSIPTSVSLPGEGFEGVAVALIAFNSPLGLIPAAVLWSIINIGSANVSIYTTVPRELTNLLSGLIMYSIAMSLLFLRFKPLKSLRMAYLFYKNGQVKKEFDKYKLAKKSQKKLFNNKEYFIKYNEIKKLNKDYNEARKKCHLKINSFYKSEFSFIDGIKFKFINFIIKLFKLKNELKKPRLSSESQIIIENIISEFDDLERLYKVNLNQLMKNTKMFAKKEEKRNQVLVNKIFKRRINLIYSNSLKDSFIGKVKLKYQFKKDIFNKYNNLQNKLYLNFKCDLELLKNSRKDIKKKNLNKEGLKNINFKIKNIKKRFNSDLNELLIIKQKELKANMGGRIC